MDSTLQQRSDQACVHAPPHTTSSKKVPTAVGELLVVVLA